MDGWMVGWTGGWVDGRVDGWMGGWVDEPGLVPAVQGVVVKIGLGQCWLDSLVSRKLTRDNEVFQEIAKE